MELESSVSAPHSLLIGKSMALSESMWLVQQPGCHEDSGLIPHAGLYAYWPDGNGLSARGKLDSLQPLELPHNLVKDLHVLGSYVTDHLPLEHPHVINTTHDDRAEEGVFLGNDLPLTS
jgi:hypothetical protein